MKPTLHHLGKHGPLNLHEFRRVVCWFSCGATSAVATSIALQWARALNMRTAVAYCDTGAEHEDNPRFMADCAKWFDHDVEVIRHAKYADTWSLFEAERWLNGIGGAKCTAEFKRHPRDRFEEPGDLHVFGFDASEWARAARYGKNQPEVALWAPLIDAGIKKHECFSRLASAGIRLPTMYLLGYLNNNCIGCVKGGAGYWNKIRRDFPATFARMSELETRLGAHLCTVTGDDGIRRRVTLAELPADAGRYGPETAAGCGFFCEQPEEAE